MLNKLPEILSPAGSWETLKAAVASGADAVYFGGHAFNARRNAGNFSDEEITKAVSYCHARGVKAYLTLNTILFQNELKASLNLIKRICGSGADAVIVQDPGIVRLLRSAAPSLRLHASTQMSVHNPDGVEMLAQMGFKRVVLSRELSRAELEEILKKSPIEIEVFVHGALCMSISGQCYMSAMLGGRSGNRGLCAQPCRLPFSVPGGTGQDLSLRDLSLCEEIGELSRMGVASLKIEGRMKRPEYVAAATSACFSAVKTGVCSPERMAELQSVFSRGGFTKGYYSGRLGRDMFGARGHEDVLASLSVLKKIRSEYEGLEPARVPVVFSFEAQAGSPAVLQARDGDGNSARVTGETPEPARTKAIEETLVKDKLSKTGGTPFFLEDARCDIAPGLSVPVSSINRMRREALQAITEKRMEAKPVPFTALNLSTYQRGHVENASGLRIRLRSIRQLTEKVLASGAEMIDLPYAEIAENADQIREAVSGGVRIGAELPRAIFGTQWREIEKNVSTVKKAGVSGILCGNLGAVGFALRQGFAAHGDFGLNAANSFALDELKAAGLSSCVLSFEQTLSDISDASGASAMECGVIAYGRLPLMLTRNCPIKNGAGCAACGGEITDRRGISFPVACFGGASEILNSRPLWMCDRKDEIYNTGVHFAQLYFTLETAEQTDSVLGDWLCGRASEGEFTRGLYYRGVQ